MNKLIQKLNAKKGHKILRVLLFIGSIIFLIFSISFLNNDYLYIREQSKGSNLDVLFDAIESNWLLSFKISFIVINFSLFIIYFIASLTTMLWSKKFIVCIVLCYLGVFPIVFIFTLILASTKPSETTIVFSVFSCISACIAFCFSVFSSYKK